MIENYIDLPGGSLKKMSEQQVLDCTYTDYDACQGGWMGDAFDKIYGRLGNR